MNQNFLNPDKLDAIGKGYHAQTAKSWSLHADAYRAPVFLEIERRQIFYNSWQFLCHEEKLRDPGSYVATSIQGQSIVACRGAGGKLRAFYNVCKHRGHELLRGAGKTNVIVCPYHAWSYNLDGRLLKARCSEFVEDFDSKQIRLTEVQAEVFCNLVFVNLNSQAAPLAKQSGALADEVLQYAPDISNLTFSHRLTYDINANWKAVVDNFLECCHCPVAHRDFCTLVEMNTYKVKTHGIYSSHMAKAGRGGNNAYTVKNAEVTDHAVWYLWPNTTLMRYPGRGNFMVWQFHPSGPETTHEIFDFFFETPEMNEAEKEAVKFIDEVLQPEDISLVESVQRGMHTPAFEQGRYLFDPKGSGLSEHAVHHFHGLVLDAYRQAMRS